MLFYEGSTVRGDNIAAGITSGIENYKFPHLDHPFVSTIHLDLPSIKPKRDACLEMEKPLKTSRSRLLENLQEQANLPNQKPTRQVQSGKSSRIGEIKSKQAKMPGRKILKALSRSWMRFSLVWNPQRPPMNRISNGGINEEYNSILLKYAEPNCER